MFKRVAIFTLAVLILQSLLFAAMARAGTFEFQAKQVGNAEVWKYTSTVAFGEKLSSHLGWTGFVLSSNTWSEAYVGPTYSPKSWLTVATCLGVEEDAQISRFAAWYYLSNGNWSLFHVMEDGGSGRWHKLLASYDFGRGKVQYWDQDGLGRGPRLEVNLPGDKVQAKVYVSILWEGDQTNQAVGLIKSF